MKLIRSWLAGILAASAVLSGSASALESTTLGEAVVRLGPPGPASVVLAPAGFSAQRRTATFAVTYVGFSVQAKAAFQRAVDIWATQLTSPVTIRVHAQWANLGSTGILGSAGPVTFFSCPSGCPARVVANTWYPVAIINKLSGHDVATSLDDINARFNSTFTAWYFGTGPAPAGKVDFTSVVLHELGHGLGFIGSGALVNGNTQGSVRTLGGNRPTIYDRYTVNGGNTKLVTLADPSLALKNQMVNNNLYFRIPSTGVRYRLFAPNPFQPGSSYSHLNEASYPKGNANSLMTPSISTGETIRNPGPMTLAMFKLMGWN